MIDSKFDKYQAYMRTHRINELFEDLCAAVAYKRPASVREFLIQQLELRQVRQTVTLPLFTEQEIENVFFLYNLRREETIPRFKALEALKCLANSGLDLEATPGVAELPEAVSLPAFKALAARILGITY